MTATAELLLPASADGTPEWLKQRTQGIGGTDAADLHLGHKSPFRLWREKKGLVPAEEITPEMQARFDYGHSREPELARIFTQRTGLRIRNTGTWARKDRPWALANPDRFVGPDGLLEIKTTGAYTDAAKDWRAERVNPRAWVQAHWYAYVTGRTQLWFIAEVDRVPYILGPFQRDEALVEDLAAKAGDLWDLVQRGDEPAPTAPDAPLAYPKAIEGLEAEVEPWDDIVTDLQRWHDLTAQKKELEAELKDIEGAVKLRMGDAEALVTTDGAVLATWKEVTRKGSITEKALKEAGLEPKDYRGKSSTYRRLTPKEIAR